MEDKNISGGNRRELSSGQRRRPKRGGRPGETTAGEVAPVTGRVAEHELGQEQVRSNLKSFK